jgi:hypothetical protein
MGLYLAVDSLQFPTVECDICDNKTPGSTCGIHVPGGNICIVAVDDVVLDKSGMFVGKDRSTIVG